jgi:hypothetical protein
MELPPGLSGSEVASAGTKLLELSLAAVRRQRAALRPA